MRRGLDGFSCFLPGIVRFSSSTGAVSNLFGGEIARGKHLFPFRTEPLSLSAPMVLGGQPPGRVGRRRSYLRAAPEGRLFFYPLAAGGPPRLESLERAKRPDAAASRPDRGDGAERRRRGAVARSSQSRTGSGSIPYSPSVAKSIIRSAASSSRSLMSMSLPAWEASYGWPRTEPRFAGEIAGETHACDGEEMLLLGPPEMLPARTANSSPSRGSQCQLAVTERRFLRSSCRHHRGCRRIRRDLLRVGHVPGWR